MALILPNVKKIFLVDEGMEMADVDGSAADLRVVVWDSDCRFWKDYFNSGNKQKPYAYMASQFFGKLITEDDEYYRTTKGIYHGLNYKMGLDKLAKTAGIPYELAKQLATHYFTLCPEIRLWQTRIENQIRDYGYLDTVWGRRRWFLKRNDPNILNKAVSFRPQSIVSDTLNRGWLEVVKTLPDAQVALNVHDSLVIQYPIEKAEEYRTLIPKLLEVPIPYKPEPLIIPMALKWSRTSYGEMTKVK